MIVLLVGPPITVNTLIWLIPVTCGICGITVPLFAFIMLVKAKKVSETFIFC